MTVLTVSTNTQGQADVLCVICLLRVPLESVTPGSLYADGHQAFACTLHLNDRTRWIVDWAVFDYRQQQLADCSAVTKEDGR